MSGQRGFSLIELMVGIVVAIIGLLAVTYIFIEFSHHRNTETSLMEAQSNGAMALYMLERDLSQAGFGLAQLKNCNCRKDSGDQTNAFCEYWKSDDAVHAQSALPIMIADGGDGVSDSIFVQYATPSSGLNVYQILIKQLQATDDFELKSVAGITANDKLVLNRGGNCAMYQATAVATATKSIAHASGEMTPNPDPLPGVGYELAMPNDAMINLGQFVSKNFVVNAATSQLQENTRPTYANNTALMDNIVYLKAELGTDTDGDKIADTWSKPAVSPEFGTIVAARVGIVARSQVKDTESPTAASLEVLPAMGAGDATSYTVPDKKYRYKVYYTVIPLRNMLWN